MKKVILILVGILALAAVVVLGLAANFKKKGVKVYVARVEEQSLTEVVKASGEINAREQVNISSHVIGKIEKIFVREGDEVAAGQPFLELEKVAFKAARDDWEARLQMANNEVEQAKIELADSEIRLNRARRLNQEGIVAVDSLQAAELAYNSANLRQVRAQEAVIQAKANLTSAQNDLKKTTIYSPLAGRVVSLPAKEGEVVISGTINNPASVIAKIADLSEVLAEVDVDETEIVKIRLGQEAAVRVDALAGQELSGKVVEIGNSGFSRAAQPDVTFFLVKVLIDQPDPALRPGMSVRADIKTASGTGKPVVPIQAVVQRPVEKPADASATSGSEEEEPVVYTFEDGKAKRHAVSTGLADETHVEVLSGLTVGQQVITGPYRALKDLKDGAAVEIRTQKSDDAKDDEAEVQVKVE